MGIRIVGVVGEVGCEVLNIWMGLRCGDAGRLLAALLLLLEGCSTGEGGRMLAEMGFAASLRRQLRGC